MKTTPLTAELAMAARPHLSALVDLGIQVTVMSHFERHNEMVGLTAAVLTGLLANPNTCAPGNEIAAAAVSVAAAAQELLWQRTQETNPLAVAPDGVEVTEEDVPQTGAVPEHVKG